MNKITPAGIWAIFLGLLCLSFVNGRIWGAISLGWWWCFTPLWLPILGIVGTAFVRAINDVRKKSVKE